ncbi:hypothetical protein DRV60_25975 [Salmonella enterica subsp. enterica]|nr:hypothetical protein [Salmonella enterica subsp. enterica serovar Pomona]EAM8425590.1 hypothetical protein [Salmonella enterica]EBS0894974.1 hypothetical protein [Salmonella enterica subsp. enterica serovar Abaetetuba]ECD1969988.1 hypothetical protein [Salmonella enterica subsp. enterica serovar Abaetetuba]
MTQGLYIRKVIRIAPCSNASKVYIITTNASLFPAEQKDFLLPRLRDLITFAKSKATATFVRQ